MQPIADVTDGWCRLAKDAPVTRTAWHGDRPAREVSAALQWRAPGSFRG